MGSIPNEAITGRLTSRTPAGYIKEQTVIDAYKKVRRLTSCHGVDCCCSSQLLARALLPSAHPAQTSDVVGEAQLFGQ